jgi:hypothetical protein
MVSPLVAWYGRALAAGAVPPRLQIVLVGPPPVADLLAAAIAPLLPATAPVDWRRVANDADVAPTPAPPSGPRIWIDGRLPGTIQIVAFCRDAVPRVRTLSFLDLSLGLGGGIQTASTNAIFVARGTASVGLRLGAGIEQILSATIDAGQAPQVSELWPTPARVRPGVMIGLGWRPHW